MTHTRGRIVATMATLLLLAGVSAGSAQDAAQPAGETTAKDAAASQGNAQKAHDYVLKAIAPLGYDRTRKLFDQVGIDKSAQTAFYACLCSAGAVMGSGVGFYPEPGGDCQNTLPCKGGNWGCVAFDFPADQELWARCAARQGNGNILDTILAKLKRPDKPPAQSVPSAPDNQYKKLCDAAFLTFPRAAPRVAEEGTGIIWDNDMISKSFQDAIAAYQKDHEPGQPSNAVSTNRKMGSAEGYGLWLFGHGQDVLGGPQSTRIEAGNAVRLDEVRTILKQSRAAIQEARERFHKRFEYDSPTNQDTQKFLDLIAKLQNRVDKLEIEERALTHVRDSVRQGTEMALLDAIKAAKSAKPKGEKLTPGDVLYLALKQTDGKVNQALLLSHNTLRALARPGLGDFEVTGVQEERSFFDETFVRLREGDNTGPFYHIFGTAFFAYQQRVSNLVLPQIVGSEAANLAEQVFRETYPKSPQLPDPVKYCFNYWGAEAGSALYDLAHAAVPRTPMQ